jgi:AcrR family transcriptional regulator
VNSQLQDKMTIEKLDLRVEPKQSRAHERIETILAITEGMLETGERVTTSAIAAKAGIPVGSIYRYFPNIFGVYRQLFDNLNGDMHARVKGQLDNDQPSLGWLATYGKTMAVISETYHTRPAFGVLLTMMGNPILRAAKAKSNEEMASLLSKRWQQGRDGFHSGDPKMVAKTVIELIAAVELCYFQETNDKDRDDFYAEGSKAIAAYLSLYLKD